MITKKLIAMLDTHAADLSSSWVKMVRENENIHVYKTLDDDILANRAYFIYEQLKTWLDWQTTSAVRRRADRRNRPSRDGCGTGGSAGPATNRLAGAAHPACSDD